MAKGKPPITTDKVFGREESSPVTKEISEQDIPTITIPVEEVKSALENGIPGVTTPLIQKDAMSELLGHESVPKNIEDEWRERVGEKPKEEPQVYFNDYSPLHPIIKNIEVKPGSDPLLVDMQHLLWRIDKAFLLVEVPQLRMMAKDIQKRIEDIIQLKPEMVETFLGEKKDGE